MSLKIKVIILAIAVIGVAAGIFIAVQGFSKNINPQELVEEEASNRSQGTDENQSADSQGNKATEEQSESSGVESNESSVENDSEEEKEESKANRDLETIYEEILKSGKPSIIVFSYDAECCESTRIFFENYNKKALEIINANKEKFDTLFINTGILGKEDMETALKIAEDNRVVNLPSILILDPKGKPYKVISDIFEESEINKGLEEVIDA
ncbi:MAG: hypothetical protein ACQEP5_09835 [Actinomycetota bacterium]